MSRSDCARLEKARTEELSSFEIKCALRELTGLNGCVGVTKLIMPDGGKCTVIVGENSTGRFEKRASEVEDALVAAYDTLLTAIAGNAEADEEHDLDPRTPAFGVGGAS